MLKNSLFEVMNVEIDELIQFNTNSQQYLFEKSQNNIVKCLSSQFAIVYFWMYDMKPIFCSQNKTNLRSPYVNHEIYLCKFRSNWYSRESYNFHINSHKLKFLHLRIVHIRKTKILRIAIFISYEQYPDLILYLIVSSRKSVTV